MASPTTLPSRLALDAVAPYAIPAFERAGLLRLDINERPDGAPPYVIDAIRDALGGQQVATYPSYANWLEHASRWYGVAQDHIVPTCGADEGIRAIINTWLMPGTALITHAPGFDMFALGARLHGNPVTQVSWRKEEPALLVFDEDAWFSALQPPSDAPQPGLVAIANPCNPTGAMVPREAIVRTLTTVQCPVIVDETYGAFLGETVVDLLDEYPHLFIVRSFSKVHGLAGLRIGATLSNATNIAGLRRVLNPYNVGRAAIAASIACMQRPEAAKAHVAAVREARTTFVHAMHRMGLQTGSEHANFVLVHAGTGCAKLTDGLRDEAVLIRNRDGSHPDLAGCVRVAIGTSAQMLRVAGGVRKHIRPPPHLECLLLDMDGTLVDVSASYRRAIRETSRQLLRAAGRPDEVCAAIDDGYVDRFKARGGLNNDWDCTAAICREQGVKVPRGELIGAFQALYRGADFDGYIASEPWLLSAECAALARRLWRVALVTGRPRAEAQWTLDRHSPDLVEVLVGMEDTVADKPSPEPIDRGLRLLGGGPAAYIGDSVDDMRAAVAAGVFAIGVLTARTSWQSGWPERLHEAGADVVFASIDDAIRWLATDMKTSEPA